MILLQFESIGIIITESLGHGNDLGKWHPLKTMLKFLIIQGGVTAPAQVRQKGISKPLCSFHHTLPDGQCHLYFEDEVNSRQKHGALSGEPASSFILCYLTLWVSSMRIFSSSLSSEGPSFIFSEPSPVDVLPHSQTSPSCLFHLNWASLLACVGKGGNP